MASANRELVTLYWQIGRDILDRQQQQGWGASVVDRLARDLKVAFPDMRGFSPRNLKYMRALTQAFPQPEFVQQPVAQLPWSRVVTLLDNLDSDAQRLWYAEKSLEHGWSRSVNRGRASAPSPSRLRPPDSTLQRVDPGFVRIPEPVMTARTVS
ncbi:DUF1016 N-terminal domain-containing protein [Paraburkholderia mimosarum]|uniref:DUF1016 N-terminal domain-containing protein n=1 Tax=Paraburkholderia mimosarum TaxID=312026 RepID=UPI0039C15F86